MKRKQKRIQEGKAVVKAKDISRKGKFGYKTVKATFMPQSDLDKHKVFVLERLERNLMNGKHGYNNMKIGDIEYRIGYYIVGKNGHLKNKWAWGQSCPLIPLKDLKKLLTKAEKEGTLLE